MAEAARPYRYVAIDRAGRRVKGVLTAEGEGRAFERLRSSGVAPILLTPDKIKPQNAIKPTALTDRETVDFIGNLGHLLAAGADIRTALNILGSRTTRKPVARTCKALVIEIGGGAPLDATFDKLLVKHGAFVAAMVGAGEASGDLPGGLSRAAEIIDSRAKLRAKVVSTLAYPAFVLLSTVLAVLALLLFVIPSLAPLVEGSGTPAPPTLRLMISASSFLRENVIPLEGVGLVLLLLVLAAARTGLLRRTVDRLLLGVLARRTSAGLIFGGFAIVAGGMLGAGAPMSETLRLAVRSLQSPVGRRRLVPVQQMVRQGESLSAALEKVKGFPNAVARLAAVGEATGSLGPMLVRAGKLEEETAIARIERAGQILGPALIVLLGGVVGLLMAGLLSGVSQLGQSALQ
jgi:type II secretory pathway component PulF